MLNNRPAALLALLILAPTAYCAEPSTRPPLEVVESSPQGSLKNPYPDSDPALVEEGKKVYFSKGCNGCHGGGGGGGMCPPLSNEVWVYGGDDDTLFRLITLGSDGLAKAGYTRKRTENVKAPMVPFHALIKTEDELWKIITFIRANYRGGETKKYGDQPAK